MRTPQDVQELIRDPKDSLVLHLQEERHPDSHPFNFLIEVAYWYHGTKPTQEYNIADMGSSR